MRRFPQSNDFAINQSSHIPEIAADENVIRNVIRNHISHCVQTQVNPEFFIPAVLLLLRFERLKSLFSDCKTVNKI